MMSKLLSKTVSVFAAAVMLAAVMAQPSSAASVKDYPVGQLLECGSRNKIGVANGMEFKCSISGGGLKWKRTGKKAGAETATGPTVNLSAFANVSGIIAIDGSSTVAPLTSVAAEAFEKASKTKVVVGISGTGGGATKFCNGEIDIANASTKYTATQLALCEKNGIKVTELRLATDALSVVVNPRNTFIKCLSIAQLKRIWEPNSKLKYWSELDKSFPRVKMALFGAGTDSGTFTYFTEVVNGKSGASRVDYTPTEDDNVTVNGVRRSLGALGYYGFSYYKENSDINRAIAIDHGRGAGCVLPSEEAVVAGTYTPLARPLFIYVNNAKAASNQAVLPFLEFYALQLSTLAERAKFLPLSAAQKKSLDEAIAKLKG
jgi:phosphate transport system substrate-binding protein